MPDIDPAAAEHITLEEQRLVDICQAADRYNRERKEKLQGHDQKMRRLKTERLNSTNPREKDKLTFEMQRLAQHDRKNTSVIFRFLSSGLITLKRKLQPPSIQG